jgi:Protein of unknown function (DUF433)
MRILVSVIAGQIAHGANWDEVLADYPDLDPEDPLPFRQGTNVNDSRRDASKSLSQNDVSHRQTHSCRIGRRTFK